MPSLTARIDRLERRHPPRRPGAPDLITFVRTTLDGPDGLVEIGRTVYVRTPGGLYAREGDDHVR